MGEIKLGNIFTLYATGPALKGSHQGLGGQDGGSNGQVLIFIPAMGFCAHCHGSSPEHAALISLLQDPSRHGVNGLFFFLQWMTEFTVEDVKEGT